jgi:hypothetical protein
LIFSPDIFSFASITLSYTPLRQPPLAIAGFSILK